MVRLLGCRPGEPHSSSQLISRSGLSSPCSWAFVDVRGFVMCARNDERGFISSLCNGKKRGCLNLYKPIRQVGRITSCSEANPPAPDQRHRPGSGQSAKLDVEDDVDRKRDDQREPDHVDPFSVLAARTSGSFRKTSSLYSTYLLNSSRRVGCAPAGNRSRRR